MYYSWQIKERACCYNIMKADQEPCKGFLISCDKNREKQAVRDAYNFLTEYIEQIYSDVTQQQIHKRIKQDGKQINLQTEVAYNRRAETRLLSQIQTHVNCVCFIKINPVFKQIDPLKVVEVIMKDIHHEGREITRFCHRIVPVQRAFRAEHFRMLDQLDELLSIHSHGQEIKSWMLNFKCRNNNKFNYKQILKQVEKLTKKYNHFPDIYYPQWAITIEISNHLMCLSIGENFKQTNQWKLHKKLDKIKYTNQENEQMQRLNNEKVKQLEKKQKQQKDQKQQKAAQEHQNNKQKTERQQQQAAQNILLQQKIVLKQDDVDLF